MLHQKDFHHGLVGQGREVRGPRVGAKPHIVVVFRRIGVHVDRQGKIPHHQSTTLGIGVNRFKTLDESVPAGRELM